MNQKAAKPGTVVKNQQPNALKTMFWIAEVPVLTPLSSLLLQLSLTLLRRTYNGCMDNLMKFKLNYDYGVWEISNSPHVFQWLEPINN